MAEAFAEVPDIPALEIGGLESEFAVGDIVEVHGLIQATQFNGRQGRLRFFHERLVRWVVGFDDEEVTQKNLQARNLRLIRSAAGDVELLQPLEGKFCFLLNRE